MKPILCAFVGALLVIPLSSRATIGMTLAAPSATPECWVDHAQVQPSPVRDDSVRVAPIGESYRLMSEKHVGAEHPTAAGKRPCNSPSLRKTNETVRLSPRP